MVTGDHPLTAAAIGRATGIITDYRSTEQLLEIFMIKMLDHVLFMEIH
jgi:magnesium-transporting ATPase (P-type)